jgi:hypothetical protein
MRKEIAADEKSEGTVSKDDVSSKLETVLVGVVENSFLGERIINEIGVARYGYESKGDDETEEENRNPPVSGKRSRCYLIGRFVVFVQRRTLLTEMRQASTV